MHGVLRAVFTILLCMEWVNICSRSLSDPDADENVARQRGFHQLAQKRASVLLMYVYITYYELVFNSSKSNDMVRNILSSEGYEVKNGKPLPLSRGDCC